MTVLLIGKFYVESFAQHIAETFRKMGHEVLPVEYGLKSVAGRFPFRHQLQKVNLKLFSLYESSSRYESRFLQKLLGVASRQPVDLILSCHDFLTPRQVKALKASTGAPVALWFPDPIHHFQKAMFLNAPYDHLFFKEPYMAEVLRRELLQPAYYLPECCNPDYHKRVTLTEEEKQKFGCQLTTAGNLHSSRAQFFSHFSDYQVKLWGNPAPHWMDVRAIQGMIQNEFVSNETKCKAFTGAAIVLNNLFPSEIYGVNVRTFEIAAAGGFQLVNDRKALPGLFQLDTQIVAFTSLPEARDKVAYYLGRPEERNAIAAAAYTRAQAEHTYEKRLQLLLNTVQGKATGYPFA